MIPDKAYEKSRDQLLSFEDREFSNLLSNVPNFYISSNDQTLWGSMLRDVAAELGRLEYMHSYGILAKDPAYLTPPDAKRLFADVLFVNRNYPQPYHYDSEYKNLIENLIVAFGKGATLEGLEGVIQAYTGEAITVEEKWKRIKSGVYDQSDRNTLRLTVKVAGLDAAKINLEAPGAFESSVNIHRLKHITDDLYSAIDLAKPAHIGIDLTTVFGLDESIGEHIYGDGPDAITDTLRIIAQLVEEEPLPDPLYVAPFYENHPDTGLASTDPEDPMRNVFVPPPSGGAPDQPSYTLEEFLTYSETTTKGTIVAMGNPPPNPGVLSPQLNTVWEIKNEKMDIMDMD